MTKHWYETHENLVMLATALDAACYFGEPADVIRFFEKPWKWSDEWDRWIAAGRPSKFDPEEEPEADPGAGLDWREESFKGGARAR